MPYDGGESTSKPPDSPHRGTSSTTATVPRRSIANRHVNRRLHMYANRKFGMSEQFEPSQPSYTPHQYGGGESTTIPPALPHRGTSSTTATVTRRSIANRHVIRRLHMCGNCKFIMSELFGQAALLTKTFPESSKILNVKASPEFRATPKKYPGSSLELG